MSCSNSRPHFSTESNSARKAFSDAEHGLKLTLEEAQHANQDLLDLFDADGFGVEGEWKKLAGLCLSKDTGEYVSCVELPSKYAHVAQVYLRSLPLDEAKQIPNKGGSNFSLGYVVHDEC